MNNISIFIYINGVINEKGSVCLISLALTSTSVFAADAGDGTVKSPVRLLTPLVLCLQTLKNKNCSGSGEQVCIYCYG